MADYATLNGAIHDLIDRARVADNAAGIAAENGDAEKCRQYGDRARDLMADAERLDPTHRCPAWADYAGLVTR
jgi:hypothetical protein